MHTLFLWLRTLLNLDFTGGFNMGVSFRLRYRILFNFRLWLWGGFFIAGACPLPPLPFETLHQQLLAFWLLVLPLRKSKGKKALRSERSANARVQLEIPEVTTRGDLSFFLSVRSGIDAGLRTRIVAKHWRL